MKWTNIKKDSEGKWETRVGGSYCFDIESELDAQRVAITFINDKIKELQHDKHIILKKILENIKVEDKDN